MTKEKHGKVFGHVWKQNRSNSVEEDIFNTLNGKLGICYIGSKQLMKKDKDIKTSSQKQQRMM